MQAELIAAGEGLADNADVLRSVLAGCGDCIKILDLDGRLQFMSEGGKVYACRFSAAALYGMREIDMMEGVKPINPRDVLDATITAWRERALTLNTWTM